MGPPFFKNCFGSLPVYEGDQKIQQGGTTHGVASFLTGCYAFFCAAEKKVIKSSLSIR